jgi:hypothetical protein
VAHREAEPARLVRQRDDRNVSGKTPECYTAFSLLSAEMYPTLVAALDAQVDHQRPATDVA